MSPELSRKILIEGASLGLGSAFFCLGACLPTLLPYFVAEARAALRDNLRLLGQFIGGRLIGYLIFGAVLGMVGGATRNILSSNVLGVTFLVASLLLIAYGLKATLPWPHFCQRLQKLAGGPQVPFLLGLVTGTNVCPPFLAGAARVLERGSAAFGILYFLSFFLATLVYLVPLVLTGKLGKFQKLREVARLVLILTGIWFFWQAIIHFLSAA